MIKRFCAHDRCNALVIPPEKWCPKHKPVVTHDSSHHDPFYSSRRWRKFRDWFIAQYPMCAHCGGIGRMVDHIVERKDGGADLDPENCQTLCKRCHNKKTAKVRVKRGPKVYSY